MKAILLFFVFTPYVLSAQSKQGQEPLNFSSLAISDSLKRDAHAVFHLAEGVVNVTAPGKYTFKVHQVITVLNSDGSYLLNRSFGIDKFRRVNDVDIKVFDKQGTEVVKYNKKDFAVTDAFDGISLVTDNKVMSLRLAAREFPFKLDISYTMEVTSFITLPSWYIQSPGVSIETSRFIVKLPDAIDIRYTAKDINIEPVISLKNSRMSYVWEIKNLKAKKREEGAGGFAKTPTILLAANQFEYDGYRGEVKDWKEMGIWYNQLVKNTNQLSGRYQSEIKKLVQGASTDKEKLRILYAYLQKNFRYVSIQLGIGGFKPFSADFVHEKKYGDCKALSNYMQACLSAVNIKSYSAWINAGADRAPVDPNFPYDGFNHQILCVPLDKDTIWLECTSNDADFGRLGNFTENRNALLFTEKGGILVPTPLSKANQNTFSVSSEIIIKDDGSGRTETEMHSAGEYKYELLSVSREKSDRQKYYFINYIGFPNPDEFELSFGEKDLPFLTTIIKMEVEKINDFKTGNKMFLRARIYKLWPTKLPSAEDRTEVYLFYCPFEKTDTTVFKLPQGYLSDALPKSKEIKCEYASYSARYWYDEGKNSIYSTAKLVLSQHQIPAGKYAGVKKFFDEVLMEESQKIVIRKE